MMTKVSFADEMRAQVERACVFVTDTHLRPALLAVGIDPANYHLSYGMEDAEPEDRPTPHHEAADEKRRTLIASLAEALDMPSGVRPANAGVDHWATYAQ